MESILLLIAVFLPLAAALLPGGGNTQARWRALAATLLSLALAALLVARFRPGSDDFATTDMPWLTQLTTAGIPLDVRFSIGLDGLGIWLFAHRPAFSRGRAGQLGCRPPATIALLSAAAGAGDGHVGSSSPATSSFFTSSSSSRWCRCFSSSASGGANNAATPPVKFFLFTLAGSVLTLLGLLAVVLWDYNHSAGGTMTFSIPELTRRLALRPIDPAAQWWIFLGCSPVSPSRCRWSRCTPGCRCARRGPGGRQRAVGGRAFESRRLRLPPLQHPHAALSRRPLSCPGCCGLP